MSISPADGFTREAHPSARPGHPRRPGGGDPEIGDERLVSTEVDVLGPQIRRLTTAGDPGVPDGPLEHEHRVAMIV